MNLAFLLAGAGEMIESTAKAFGVDAPHLVAQMISFGIVAFLLHRFAYRPILQALEERRRRIAESLANAERIQAELEKTSAARQGILAQAHAQAETLIAEARAAANRVQETETQKAVAAAEQIVARAREAAQADYGRMLADLRNEVGRLVVQTTARVTGKVLTAEDQQRLIEEASRELAT
ncbi:MAG TPA: F0F1 ATP synthase subunit B [Candidatus Paceibacterota bacterium]|nr:F0F1 ATP synthase subunit B [Verrucomicrobiota bacterium]HOX02602.1 F0F1 ATP synthase subunit B [Verrucomicrobiota bacterium]HRZ45256.1 F0F1 ATP synthase subunit B [Candidatus Paceibacterota bacterium]HRZ92028.1 F0F1 ATP synthase subunit B [Candidatus Paceibacterota bacterium]